MTHATLQPSSKRLVAALTAAFAMLGLHGHAFASVLSVSSCADDNGAGTLRSVAASANQGDQIDLSGLSCSNSTITLSQGEIVLAHNASLIGNASSALTVTTQSGRVFNSTSSDAPVAYLNLSNLNVSGGRVYTDADDADGGCILAGGSVTLSNVSVSDCSAGSANAMARGGAINADTVTLISSRVSGASANANGVYQTARGGGIYAANLSCTDSSLSGNLAVSAAGVYFSEGGGTFIARGNISANRCTLDGNSAGQGGAMMQRLHSGIANMTIFQNSTVSGNTAQYAGAGLMISCTECTSGTVQLFNTTIAFNSAPNMAGLSTDGDVLAQSSILANNSASAGGAADLSAASLSGASNLVVSTDASVTLGAITQSADPMLLPLADNGGATHTHALAQGSPALGQGNDMALLLTDQRGTGYARSALAGVDIGSFQTQNDDLLKQTGDQMFSGTFN